MECFSMQPNSNYCRLLSLHIMVRWKVKHLWISRAITVAGLLTIQASQVYAAADANLVVPDSKAIPNGKAVKQSRESTEQGSSTTPGTQESADGAPVNPIKHKSGFALTLAGGGARGAAHIGVLKVLEEEGLRPDFVAGNSIGAMIGGLYAAGVPVKEIERLALSGEMKKAYFPSNRKLQAVTYFGPYFMARAVLIHPQIGLYSGRSLSKFVTKHLPQGLTNIEQMPIPFSCAAVDLTTTKAVWLSKGSIADAIRASNSAPGFFRPVKVGEQVLVDGGVRANLPTEIAEAKGAPAVVAVRLQAYLEKVDQKEFDTTMNYGDRITSILLAEIENKAVDKADVLIEPKVAYMRMSSFNPDEMAAAIKSGESAARTALPKIRALQAEHAVKADADPSDYTIKVNAL
jgi:NTE family protein